MQVPKGYVAAAAAVVAIAAFVGLTATGIVTFESLFFLAVNTVVQVFAVTLLAALGGVFLGMVLAHRMLASRGFTPFEREMLETLATVRTHLERQQRMDAELVARLEGLEKRLR